MTSDAISTKHLYFRVNKGLFLEKYTGNYEKI